MGVLCICGGRYTTAGPSGELPIPMTLGPTLRNGQGGRLPSKGMVSLQGVRLVVTGPVTGPVREVNAVQHAPPTASPVERTCRTSACWRRQGRSATGGTRTVMWNAAERAVPLCNAATA